jgi:hypothetical protein
MVINYFLGSPKIKARDEYLNRDYSMFGTKLTVPAVVQH